MLVLLLLGSTFWDATSSIGLSGMSGTVAVWGDFNSDGYPDLYTNYVLYENLGGTFVSVPNAPLGFGQWGDFNNDGAPEMVNFYGDALLFTRSVATEAWSPVSMAFPPSGIIDSRGISVGDFNNDGALDVYFGAYESNGYESDVMYFGDGALSFTRDWTESSVSTSSIPYPFYSKPGRGVTSCDFDEDGDLDIYVSNYRLEQNYLWLNDGSGGLVEAAAIYGVEGYDDGWSYGYGHTIGSSWGDFDNDGHFDLFVGNFSHPLYYQDTPRFMRNTGPSGGYFFEDLSDIARLEWQESYASPSLGDYDNDGDLDLFFSTVYSGDYPVLYRNDGNWGFTDVTAEAGLSYIGATYQAGWADVDLDGDLDLASGGQLFQNQGNDNSWLLVRLVGNGITDNTSAIGAQVRIELDEMIVARQVESGTGENNSNDPTLHFGLGTQSDPVDLQITWPSGRQDTVEDVDLNQLLWVTECIDLDADGFDDVSCGGDDCNDSDDTIRPDAAETWYDGVDSDCVEDSDYDADGDGQDAEEHGGTDCDDSDPDIGDGASDTWYDGIDSDCGGDSDYDADGDGQDAEEYGGTDCNDSNPDVYLGAPDPDGDHLDQGCDGDPALTPEASEPKQESGCAHASGSGGLAAALLGMVVLWRRRE